MNRLSWYGSAGFSINKLHWRTHPMCLRQRVGLVLFGFFRLHRCSTNFSVFEGFLSEIFYRIIMTQTYNQTINDDTITNIMQRTGEDQNRCNCGISTSMQYYGTPCGNVGAVIKTNVNCASHGTIIRIWSRNIRTRSSWHKQIAWILLSSQAQRSRLVRTVFQLIPSLARVGSVTFWPASNRSCASSCKKHDLLGGLLSMLWVSTSHLSIRSRCKDLSWTWKHSVLLQLAAASSILCAEVPQVRKHEA